MSTATIDPKALTPGTVLRHRDGGTVILECRKEDDSGWWNSDGSGLADRVLTDGLEWEVDEPLTFQHVSETNLARCHRWHPRFRQPDDDWSLADWSNAMCGEAGEVANVVKKLRRYECGLKGELDPPEDELRAMLADELADVFCYLDLLASKAGVDLAAAVRRKFNAVSERHGFPERL